MIRKEKMQDHLGNIIYWHSSSDIVFDPNTGKSVKQDLDTIKKALGVDSSCGEETEIVIDADYVGGHPIEDLVLQDEYNEKTEELRKDIDDTKKELEETLNTTVKELTETLRTIIIISNSPPTDSTKLWVDKSSGEGVLKYCDDDGTWKNIKAVWG